MDALTVARTRYTTKHYDANRRVSDEDFDKILEILRLAPSSVNAQPWQFLIADTEEAKQKIMPAILDFNRDRAKNASHVVVFAVYDQLTDEYLQSVLDQEEKDGRFGNNPDIKAQQDAGRRHFVGLHQVSPSELISWEARQAYIAQGFVLMAAASMGIDTTPIEGADFNKLDAILGLREKGLRSVFLMSFGYRDPNDGNAQRPKSRLPKEKIFQKI